MVGDKNNTFRSDINIKSKFNSLFRVFAVRRQASSNPVGFVGVTQANQDSMKESLSSRELHFDFLPTTKEVSKLLQSHRCDFRVGALVATLEAGVARDVLLVVLRPDIIQVAMDVETLRVRDLESLTPAR